MAKPPGREILRAAALGRIRRGGLKLMKGFAQFVEGAMDADFYGGDAAANQTSDFVVAKFLEAAEDQELALFFGKLHQGAMQEFGFLLLLGRVDGIHGWRHFGFEGNLRAGLAKMVDAGIAGDLINPGAEGSAGAISLAVAEDAQKNFLDEILAEAAVAGQLAIKVEQRGLVAIEQHA